MKCGRVMLVAGEASGDALAAELVSELRKTLGSSPEFFGAGGPRMSEAGVNLTIDMTSHAVIGLGDVLRNYTKFRRIFNDLLKLAVAKKPDLIVLVDFSGFNRRFAKAIRETIRQKGYDWSPKIVQFVSPQVWASRPSRAEKMAKDFDLLLCLFPFEQSWYAKRVPDFKVEFVGHPIFDRYASFQKKVREDEGANVLLLPGSRNGELKRHAAVMVEAAQLISAQRKMQFTMVLPTKELFDLAQSLVPKVDNLQFQIGNLAEALSGATLAIASTGTVLLECAYFAVPTVAMYRTSWGTYQIGKRIVQVKYLSMPNILGDEMIFPEFIQDAATPENISNAALELLQDPKRNAFIRKRLVEVVASLGGPGAAERAAKVIARLMEVSDSKAS